MSLDQIKASVQQGIASVAYVGNTTPTQIKTALSSVLSNATTIHASIREIPTSEIASSKLLTSAVPQGITLATLSAPLTPDDGTVLLATYQATRDQLVAILHEYTIRIPAVEANIPGLSQFTLSTCQSISDDLAKHLVSGSPSNIPRRAYVEVQDSITAAVQKAQACLSA